MDIRHYNQRILALDKQFIDAQRHLYRLLRQLRYNFGSVKRSAIKSQLDMIKALIRLTKEETAFFVKLGRLYDVMKYHADFIDLLERRDPTLLKEILLEMQEQQSEPEVETGK